MATVEEIRAALADIIDPNMRVGLQEAGIIKDIQIGDAQVDICLCFPYPAQSAFAELVVAARARLSEIGVDNARFRMETNIHPRTVQGGVQRLPGVKNIIAVSSAKGGVGKSTTAVNVALALAQEGAAVGLLDADVYGPSLPVMTGVKQRPAGSESGGIEPISVYGLRLMSVGFMVDDDQPMVWRGPIATRTIVQLLRETQWGDIDYLILDMPPGTGDIQLTIAQQVPVTGAIIITTPQELALADARRGLVMFGKVSIPILGVVENMGIHHCPHCGNTSHIFGANGARRMCEQYDVELLGELPLDEKIRAAIDNGAPSVVAEPTGEIAACYRRIACRTAAKIAEKSRDRTAAFPEIIVSD